MTEWLISLNDKVIKRFNVKEGRKLVIGRGSDADVIVDNTAVSRAHASIELRDGLYILSDLGSMNGTFVNEKRIDGTVYITENDAIKLGKFILSKSGGGEQNATSSYGVHPDTDDKTIHVSARDIAADLEKSIKSRKLDNQLILIEGGNASPDKLSLMGKNSIKIGKASSCDMVLSGFLVADAQCYIVKHDDKYKIIPQRSWAGTFLNGTKIKEECILRKGDIIKIRSTKIRFY